MDTLLTAARENALTESERRQAEEILLRLLRERGERYLMGDSSSMPAGRAAMLLRSILFCLGLWRRARPPHGGNCLRRMRRSGCLPGSRRSGGAAPACGCFTLWYVPRCRS